LRNGSKWTDDLPFGQIAFWSVFLYKKEMGSAASVAKPQVSTWSLQQVEVALQRHNLAHLIPKFREADVSDFCLCFSVTRRLVLSAVVVVVALL